MCSPESTIATSDASSCILPIYVDQLSSHYETVSVEVCATTSSQQLIDCVLNQLQLLAASQRCQLMECVFDHAGQPVEQRVLALDERPLLVAQCWPHVLDDPADGNLHRFYVCHKYAQMSFTLNNVKRAVASSDSAVAACMDPSPVDGWRQGSSEPAPVVSAGPHPDLCQLAELTEQTLLDSLHERFDSGHIYTYASSILIAVNPFAFAAIYNPKQVALYRNRRLSDLPPHIFAIADAAYQRLLSNGVSQSVVISGESGSGKTVSSNLLLHHLTTLSQRSSRANGVVQNILAAGPVMGAFGSAKTAYNDDSSRFGRFIEVQYKSNGQVCGAVVQKYLLERSRIVRQSTSERNYHVFYYLLHGASDELRAKLHLLNPAHYCYLNQSADSASEHLEEKYEFTRLLHSMKTVGFSSEQRAGIFSLLSAILLMGNIIYHNVIGDHHDEFVHVRTSELVQQVAELLAVDQQLLNDALTCKQTRISGELVVIKYRMTEALTARDSMAKCMYAALFDWIIQQLNRCLSGWPVKAESNGYKSIGVLDIFGFEDFDNSNSFEQFCINYANERLQYYFNQHLFLYEQLVYQTEGIWWRNIEFTDNIGCIQLYENKTRGLLNILDDMCSFPGATNETLLDKFNSENKGNPVYGTPPKFEMAFFVNHYAGKVKYQIAEFREKNLDLMRPAIVSVLKSSQNVLIRQLISYSARALLRWSVLRHFCRALTVFKRASRDAHRVRADSALARVTSVRAVSRSLSVPNIAEFVSAAGEGGGDVELVRSHFQQLNSRRQRPAVKSVARRSASTVAAQFQQSLQKLMDTLSSTEPFFIRCIRSNLNKDPNHFDVATVSRQLRYTGMLETVRIRQCGYDVRIQYEQFVQIYGPIVKLRKPHGSLMKHTVDILSASGISPSVYQLGSTRLFIREPVKLRLDLALDKVFVDAAVLIQQWYRRVSRYRRQMLVFRSVIRIQSYVRGFLARRYYHTLCVRRMAAILIQKIWRGHCARLRCARMRRSALTLPLKPIAERFVNDQISTPDTVSTLSFSDIDAVATSPSLNDDSLLMGSPRSPHSAPSSPDTGPSARAKDDSLLVGSPRSAHSEPPSPDPGPRARVNDDNLLLDSLLSPTSEQLSPDARLHDTIDRQNSVFVRNSSFRLASRLRCEKRPSVPPPPVPSQVSAAKHSRESNDTATIAPPVNGTSLPTDHKPPASAISANNQKRPTVDRRDRSHQLQSQLKPSSKRNAKDRAYSHRLHLVSRLPRGELCLSCNKPFTTLLVFASKCSFCHQYIHSRCQSANQICPALANSLNSERVVAASERLDYKNSVIGDVVELRMLQSLISMKIECMEVPDKRTGNRTSADRVFIGALRLFHARLAQLNPVRDGEPDSTRRTAVNIVIAGGKQPAHSLRYGDLVEQFTQILKQRVDETASDFPVTMGVNAFRSYLDEMLESPAKSGRKRRRRKVKVGHSESAPVSLFGHIFGSTVINIPTACEICSKLLSLTERGYVCGNCKFICHKKCLPKVKSPCSRFHPAVPADSARVFGRDLTSIMSDDDVLPVAVSRLLSAIERRGLRVEGIYRKSGLKRCIDELQRLLDADQQHVFGESVSVHALTGAVKAWLRQLPEPLLTFSMYPHWLRAARLVDAAERVETLYQLLSQLPAANCRVMEQLLFHLSRVALHESDNLMSPRALAIVMSQCLLRPDKLMPAQEMLREVEAQTQCVESLIAERLRRLQVTLKNIESMEEQGEASSPPAEIGSDAEARQRPEQPTRQPHEEGEVSLKRTRRHMLAAALSQLSGDISYEDELSQESDSVDELECFRATSTDV